MNLKEFNYQQLYTQLDTLELPHKLKHEFKTLSYILKIQSVHNQLDQEVLTNDNQ